MGPEGNQFQEEEKAKTADGENSKVFLWVRKVLISGFLRKKAVVLTIIGRKATFKRPKVVSEAIFLTNCGYMVYLVYKCCLGFS